MLNIADIVVISVEGRLMIVKTQSEYTIGHLIIVNLSSIDGQLLLIKCKCSKSNCYKKLIPCTETTLVPYGIYKHVEYFQHIDCERISGGMYM